MTVLNKFKSAPTLRTTLKFIYEEPLTLEAREHSGADRYLEEAIKEDGNVKRRTELIDVAKTRVLVQAEHLEKEIVA